MCPAPHGNWKEEPDSQGAERGFEPREAGTQSAGLRPTLRGLLVVEGCEGKSGSAGPATCANAQFGWKWGVVALTAPHPPDPRKHK